MGDHVNHKKNPAKRHKRGFSESQDIATERRRRLSFKNYIQEMEEEWLEQELDEAEDFEELDSDKDEN